MSARSAWVSKDKSPQANRIPDGLRLDIPFHQGRDRVYWQRDISLNLAGYTSFQLDLTAENAASMRSLALYFKSGPGWYIWNQPLPSSGRQSIQLPKTSFQTEGSPRGWNQIEAIRISPWKGRDMQSHLVLHGLYARQDSVLLIQGTRSIQGSSEKRTAEVVARRLSGWLGQAGISHNLLRDEDLLFTDLNGVSTVILSYHHVLPDDLRKKLESFMARGGQLIVFFCKDPKLASAMGFKLGAYSHSEIPGRWAAMEFPEHEPDHFPERVIQESWNVRPVWPHRKDARVIGHWVNANGEKQPEPAWTLSRNGAWMSHILLGGDQLSKQHLLLALIGRKDPHAWNQAASTLLQSLTREAGASDFTEAMQSIAEQKDRADHPQQVIGLLEGSRRLYNKAIREYQAGQYPLCAHFGYRAKHLLMRAFGLVQTGRAKERRGVWDHHGIGWYPGNWDRTLTELKYAGFDHVYANLQWGGLAHYPSRLLPHSPTCRTLGDQAMAFRKAALAHGIEAHSWIVLWKLQNAPETFVKKMRQEDRLQVDGDGNVMPWLNPAHPENRKLMLGAIEEMLTGYKVDGIHLDYVRYPNDNCSYDHPSRVEFESILGRKVSSWPRDVRKGGVLEAAYREFRADQITAFVRSVHHLIQQVKPDTQLSAAVFGKYPECRDNVGQDWKRWIDEGLIDYVTPMNYTPYTSRFREWVEEQTREHVSPKHVLPGIGVTAAESNLSPSDVIQQIKTAREYNTPGFVLFDLDASLREDILPYLTPGILRKP